MLSRIILVITILILQGCQKSQNLSLQSVPKVVIPLECENVLSNLFIAGDDKQKQKCVFLRYQKLRSYNAYTFGDGINNTIAMTIGRSYYGYKNKNIISVNIAGKNVYSGGAFFKLRGLSYNIIAMEAPLGADIFADLAWKYNITTFVTLTNHLDNKPQKLIAYRNTTNNRVDLHYLENMHNKEFSDQYRLINIKVNKLSDNLEMIQAELQKFSHKHLITQIKFEGWIDDNSVSKERLLELVKIVDKYHKEGTLATNCFAGLHRTKTLLLALQIYKLHQQGIDVDVNEIIKEYKQQVYGPILLKYGEQAPAWVSPDASQWKLLIDFDNMLKNSKFRVDI